LIAALAALPGFAAAQPVVTSAAPDKLEVTVYRNPDRGPEELMRLDWLNGFALISERRRVQVPAGESVIRFEGVAGGIVPQSAIITGFPNGTVERNRDAYLLSPATLLDRSLGQRVHLRRTSPTGVVREQEAVVRSGAEGAVVLETEDGIEALRCTGLSETLVYDQIPPGLSARPTLSVRTRAIAPVEAEVTLSYLATGFDWQANYIAELSDDGRRMKLFAWLTLGSTDETSFPNADTQAVAGRLNYTRAEAPESEGGPLQLRCWPSATTSDVPLDQLDQDSSDEIIVTGSRVRRATGALRGESLASVAAAPEEAMQAVQEELGDLKLYRIPEPVTVAANSQKQVALLIQPDVQVQSVFRARLGAAGDGELRRAHCFIVTRNRRQEGLGLPLPAGGLVLFTQRAGRPFLAGQGRLDDRAIDEDVEIDFGESPGVSVRIAQVGAGGDGRWTDYVLTVSSDQPRPIRFEAELAQPDNARLIPRGRLTERDGLRVWAATVPANGTATFRYRVESRAAR
jgi:hypothetical protein